MVSERVQVEATNCALNRTLSVTKGLPAAHAVLSIIQKMVFARSVLIHQHQQQLLPSWLQL
jgi:hypothetical protein